MVETTIEQGALVRTSGSDSGIGRLLYVHGLGESGLCFERVIAHSELSDWQHVVPDLPGYGGSPTNGSTYSLNDYAQWLMHWVGEQPVVLVGHSMGGVIGQIMCESYPERIAGFVNVEGNISIHDCVYSNQAAPHAKFDFLDTEFANMRDRAAASSEPALKTYCRSLDLCNPAAFYHNACELVATSQKDQLAERMAALRMPSAYFFGDPGGTGSYSQDLLRRAGIDCKSMRPSGHWVFIDQPEQFVAELREFLCRLT